MLHPYGHAEEMGQLPTIPATIPSEIPGIPTIPSDWYPGDQPVPPTPPLPPGSMPGDSQPAPVPEPLPPPGVPPTPGLPPELPPFLPPAEKEEKTDWVPIAILASAAIIGGVLLLK